MLACGDLTHAVHGLVPNSTVPVKLASIPPANVSGHAVLPVFRFLVAGSYTTPVLYQRYVWHRCATMYAHMCNEYFSCGYTAVVP